MRTLARLSFVSACVAAAAVAALTQTPPAHQDEQKVVVNAGEVLFDVVVRDKRGRVVKDLGASDFEVYEDGVAQQLNSFRLVTRGGGGGVATPASNDSASTPKNQPAPAVNPKSMVDGDTGLTAVAIVFDRLTPDGRARARSAALSYVDEMQKDGLVGIFLTDLSLVVLQPYTDDMQQARKAIENAGASNPSMYASNNKRAREVRGSLVGLIQRTKGQGSLDGGLQERGFAEMEMKALEMELWSLERWEEVQRDQQGAATTNGLLAVAASLGRLPGRKAIILFSEGLIIPPSALEPFRAIVNAANKNNVSVYSVDAAGLRAESKTEETRREIESRAALRMTQESYNLESSTPMMKGLERNEDLLRLNPESGLGQLADQTGGFLISDTNDLKGRLQKVDEDLHTYYALSYTPKNQNNDGSYRKLEVKLKRPGLSVQSRKGYFAINGAYASPVLSYEVPALAALGGAGRPDSFPFRAAAFSFPETGRAGLAPVVVEAPLSDFSLQADDVKKTYSTDFSIVVLVKNESGQVVEKLSNQYRLSGPVEKMEEVKRGRVLFYREAELAPGSYRFEAVAYDRPTNRASVRTGTLEVPADDEGKLRLSSVLIVGSAEKAVGEAKAGNPFQVGELLLYPNTGEAVRKEAGKQLPFFFTVYTPQGTTSAPKLVVELRQSGKTLASIPAQLGAPDAQGRIQYVAGLPLESIPPGAYELRVTVEDGKTSVSRSTTFSVEK
ncbi:MAG TPA: VWA domain-containing protein [Pyrinomonadaceae bacterium]|jgi:VWFA-related protein|nr:VWA domain-containing protein [Pyrinomonadaceae bacterium]